VVLVLGLVAAAGWQARGVIQRTVAAVVDRVGDTRSVEPVGLTASSAAPGHPVTFLRDATNDRFWAPRAGGDGRGQFVDVRFRQPFRLVAVTVFNGASVQPQPFRAQARPRTLRLTFTRAGGQASVREVTLKDQPGQQDLYLGVDDVTALRMTIIDSSGVKPGALVALAEVDFRERAF
jgi:hypothetical protein